MTQSGKTFEVFIQDEKLLFDVVNVESSQNLQGWQVLYKVFPPVLYFRGPQNVIRPLVESENMGKPVTVTGYLYPATGLLQVEEITYGE